MFNNLIESSSHRGELKRRGSFFLFTVATYALLFAIAGVASIYAYDAKLAEQDLELVVMTSPVEVPVPPTEAPDRQREVSPNDNHRNSRNYDERETPMLSVNRPELTPKDVSTTPNKVPPIRDNVRTFFTGRDRNADVIAPGGRGGTGGVPTTNIEITTPPPEPAPKPSPKTIRASEVLNGRALSLPKPMYSPMARQLHVQGKVNVQVLLDETGKVVSAKALDGHPLLRSACEAAAYQARFSPTYLNQQAVKVSGLITYNFVMQ